MKNILLGGILAISAGAQAPTASPILQPIRRPGAVIDPIRPHAEAIAAARAKTASKRPRTFYN
jgi:hypothetical protein